MNAKVNITVKQKSVAIPKEYRALIRKACNATLKYEGFTDKAEINVTIVDDAEIQELNREFRDIDKSTDVLSFPLGEDGVYDYNPETDALMLGDIVLNVDRIKSQAEEYGHTKRRELAFLVAHSMLHLAGYDHIDDDERQIMEQLQETILTMKGYTRDNEKE